MRSAILALVLGVALCQNVPTSDRIKSKLVILKNDKSEDVDHLHDLQPSATSPFGPSIFSQSFALRRVAPLMPNPRLGNGPRLDTPGNPHSSRDGNDDHNDNPRDTLQKRGGSVGYGGVYPLKFNRGPGGGHGGHGHDEGYGGRYNSGHPPRHNNEHSEDDAQGYDGDYGGDYDEYNEGGEGNQAGGRHSGGEGEAGNYDYGGPPQSEGYRFSGQPHGENHDDHDDQGRGGERGNYEGEGSDSGNHYNSDGNSEGSYRGEDEGTFNSFPGNNFAGEGETGYNHFDDFF